MFEPLGMVDTGFWVPPTKRHRLADVYAESPSRPIGEALVNVSTTKAQLGYIGKEPPVFSSGGGGLVSTMYDYARFCQCIANGGELDNHRLLGVKTIEWMAINHLPEGKTMAEMPAPNVGYSELAAPGTGFGLGFAVVQNPTAGKQIGSIGQFSWGGAANTIFWIDPEEDLFVIWMTQVLNQNRQKTPIRQTLGNLVYGAIADGRTFNRQRRYPRL